MDNPWPELRVESPWVLHSDRSTIDAFNARYADEPDFIVRPQLLPDFARFRADLDSVVDQTSISERPPAPTGALYGLASFARAVRECPIRRWVQMGRLSSEGDR